ncbi:MAG TPA: hypothetical protein VG225_11675 [Terracidiphilus sp.]|jgi:hypothetical protein|nr:hypothetical protein [Terracidiphilus sp.]
MKFLHARGLQSAAAAACLAGFLAAAQTTTPPYPVPKPNEPPPSQRSGQVIFSRSTDENGNTTTHAGPAAHPGMQMANAPTAQDAERLAVTFTGFDLDVHLRPAEHSIGVRAQLAIRNDGQSPLAHVPLQISSSLNWERIRVQGRDVSFPVALLNSDADHTGQLREAAIPLATPLAPGSTLQLDVTYSGTIPSNARRLLAIGTPQDAALHSDWDQIDTDFTGLRGFGNVVWYPVSSVPVMLGDGARLFDEMGEHKLRLAGAHFGLRLTVEFPHGQAPTVVLINGHPAPLTVTDAGSDEVAGVATAQTDRVILGFEAPSLFVAIRKQHPGTNLTAWTTADNDINVQLWLDAAATVTPFLQGWLGQQPRAQLTLLDLPDKDDAPFETGALLAATLREASPEQLNGALAHALTHAWMQSPRAWLSEGVAHFMGTLWIEKQQGREKALSALEAGRGALALGEPESPAMSAGQPLAQAISPVFYRTKAAYVLWMLRDIAGDATLSAALRAYDPMQDLGNPTVPSLFEKLLEQAGQRRDLSWFFADWVDSDKGLPDLTVKSVFPSGTEAGNSLVAVTLSNSGYVAAEVPVTVRTDATSVTQRMRIPARGSAVQRILIQGRPTEVQVNDGTVPETEASVHLTKIEQSSK